MNLPREEPPAPRRLGRYELIRPIGQGGMATVYLARVAGVGGFERLVAVKVCHPHLHQDQEFVAMFRDEARLAARIHHPNVIATLDVGEDEGLYLVMEYVEGVSLAELLHGHAGSLPVPIALRIVMDVLAGLHAAHETRDTDGAAMNLVHRDVSPQNILVGSDGNSRILDFGIAKAEARTTVTRGHQIKGKLGYMPAEQFLGQPVTRQADVYAAAVVLWEMLAGRRLFSGDSDAAVMNLVLRGKVEPLFQINASVSPTLQSVIERGLARNTAGRYPDARTFLRALEQAGTPVADAEAVATAMGTVFDTWIRDRRKLVEDARSVRAVAAVPVAASPTFVARMMRGELLVVSRGKAIGVGLLAAVAMGLLFWQPWKKTPAPVRTSVPAVPVSPRPPVETAPPPEPAPVAVPAVAPAKAARPVKVAPARKGIRSRRPKPPAVFRPTDL